MTTTAKHRDLGPEYDEEDWYICPDGVEPIGPLSALEIYQRIRGRKLCWVDFTWNRHSKQHSWERISTIDLFRALMDPLPDIGLLLKIQESLQSIVNDGTQTDTLKAVSDTLESNQVPKVAKIKIDEETRNDVCWFINFEGNKSYGPLSVNEIQRFAEEKIINGYGYVWRKGMKEWKGISDVDEFQEIIHLFPRPTRRKTKRVPLVASIIVRVGAQMILGSIRDISAEGMMVLTSQTPGPIGTEASFSVNPMTPGLEPLQMDGKIVRILENGLGFGVQFTHLPLNARMAIENFVNMKIEAGEEVEES